jgi:hypothetical protein
MAVRAMSGKKSLRIASTTAPRGKAMSLPSARSPPASWRRGRHLDRAPPSSFKVGAHSHGVSVQVSLAISPGASVVRRRRDRSTSAVQQFSSSAVRQHHLAGDARRGEGGTAALVLMHFFFDDPRGCGTCARSCCLGSPSAVRRRRREGAEPREVPVPLRGVRCGIGQQRQLIHQARLGDATGRQDYPASPVTYRRRPGPAQNPAAPGRRALRAR